MANMRRKQGRHACALRFSHVPTVAPWHTKSELFSKKSYGVSEEKRGRTNILCLKANTWRLKNISCNRNEPKQCASTR